MKRVWMGGGLLALLRAAALLVGAGIGDRMEPSAHALRQAGMAAQAGDWMQAEQLASDAQGDWQKMSWITAALTGHEEVEQINDAFVQLPVYARRDANDYHALCVSIAEAMDALAQNHSCTWKNFF